MKDNNLESANPNHAERVTYGQVAKRARELGRPIPKGKTAPPLPMGKSLPASKPIYSSWEAFIQLVPDRDIRAWCTAKAHTANKERFMTGKQPLIVTAQQIYEILFRACGRCFYCGSLCVEKRPSLPNGRPAKWESVGRRIGSLGHKTALMNGGTNAIENLCWSCLWCNVWPSERVMGSTDHGGIQL
jgi:hypothetical protein